MGCKKLKTFYLNCENKVKNFVGRIRIYLTYELYGKEERKLLPD